MLVLNSVEHLMLTISGLHFKTSYVGIKQRLVGLFIYNNIYFKTSYVGIKPRELKTKGELNDNFKTSYVGIKPS